MFDNMAYDFMVKFNWTLEYIDSIPFPVALSIRDRMVEEQKRIDKQQRDANLRAKTGRR